MKFSAQVADLRNALKIVNMALQPKTPNPILECVMLDASDGKLKLIGSDSLMQISFTIPCDIDEPGVSAVRGKLLADVVQKMPDGRIDVTTDDKEVFTVKCGRAKSRLAGQDAKMFPLKPDIATTNKITIQAVEFYNMIVSVEKCIAREDMRAVLTGGCIDVQSGVVSMVGLDGFRLGVMEIKPSSLPDDCKVIVPGRSLEAIKRLLVAGGEELIDLNFSASDFEMQFGSADIKCTLIEGEYVNWRGIMPKSYTTLCTVDAREFGDAVERAALMARLGANNLIRLSIQDDAISVYASSGTDETLEVLDAEVNGSPLDIAFNVVYLSDAMKMFDSGTVTLHLNNSIQPCVLCSTTTVSDFFWLILPVRTSSTAQTNGGATNGNADD
mgnify:CR=1 FL=1